MNALTFTTAISTGRVELVNVRRRALLMARLRVLALIVGFALVAALAMLRIAWLGLVEGAPEERSMAEALLPPRGEIVDRNGVPLARAFPAYALWFNPTALDDGGSPLVKSPAEVAAELVKIFPDMDAKWLTGRLASGKSGYLRRRVLPEEANRIQAIGELALEVPRETDRHYPQGTMAAHVLGYVGADGHGRVGMEAVLDKQLLDPAQRGKPAMLSIDSRVQGALEDELRRGMLAVNAAPALAQMRLFRQPPDDSYFGTPDPDAPFSGPPVWTDPGQDYERPVPPPLSDRPDPKVLYAAIEGEPFPVPAIRPSILRPAFMRRTVAYEAYDAPGSVVIDPSAHYLYFVNGDGTAIRYGVGVGRQGFSWSGTKTVTMKKEWPDWRPPQQMLARRPDLPRYMAGGQDNPLGARALYLGSSLYRIHGSNEPETMGAAVSSGCIRMTNKDVVDLYDRVRVGTKVIVRD